MDGICHALHSWLLLHTGTSNWFVFYKDSQFHAVLYSDGSELHLPPAATYEECTLAWLGMLKKD